MADSSRSHLENEFYNKAAYSFEYGKEACWTFIESKEETQDSL